MTKFFPLSSGRKLICFAISIQHYTGIPNQKNYGKHRNKRHFIEKLEIRKLFLFTDNLILYWYIENLKEPTYRKQSLWVSKKSAISGCKIKTPNQLYFYIAVQSVSHVPVFVTLWTTTCQASLSFTISWNLLKLMSIESVMLSNHLILCHPLLLLSPIFPRIRGLFQWVGSSHRVAQVLELQLQRQSFHWIFRVDFL